MPLYWPPASVLLANRCPFAKPWLTVTRIIGLSCSRKPGCTVPNSNRKSVMNSSTASPSFEGVQSRSYDCVDSRPEGERAVGRIPVGAVGHRIGQARLRPGASVNRSEAHGAGQFIMPSRNSPRHVGQIADVGEVIPHLLAGNHDGIAGFLHAGRICALVFCTPTRTMSFCTLSSTSNSLLLSW